MVLDDCSSNGKMVVKIVFNGGGRWLKTVGYLKQTGLLVIAGGFW